ncbi:unnamed protein product, partial [marine sediment metagenome]
SADKVFADASSRDLNSKLLIDCSHGNSNKDHEQQARVVEYLSKVLPKSTSIGGLMIESNLKPGNQKITENLEYGVSVTDSCIGFETTEKLLRNLNMLLSKN